MKKIRARNTLFVVAIVLVSIISALVWYVLGRAFGLEIGILGALFLQAILVGITMVIAANSGGSDETDSV